MTATRDRRSDPDEDADTAWDDRPILGTSRGLPWWAAAVLAFGLAAVGATVDMQANDALGRVYQGTYLVGCVGAVCGVRRRSLFGPMVQPPLVFAATAIAAILLFGKDSGGSGLSDLLFTVALPLTKNFPTMGITTVLVIGIGLYRLWRERDPNPPVRMSRDRRPPTDRDDDRPGRGGDGPAGRRDRPARDRGRPERAARDDRADGPPRDRRDGRGRPAGGDRREPPPRDRADRPSRDRVKPARDREDRDRDRERGRDRDRRDPDQADRSAPRRGGRGRPREEPPPRRREPGGDSRPRRDDRPGPNRTDTPPPRQPRRRPPDQFR